MYCVCVYIYLMLWFHNTYNLYILITFSFISASSFAVLDIIFSAPVKQNERRWPGFIFYFGLYHISISFANLLVEVCVYIYYVCACVKFKIYF